MSIFYQQLLIGSANGMIFALIALGYSLVYGVMGLINFAHGDVFMLAALFALLLMGAVPPTWLAGPTCYPVLLGVVVATAAFGAALNWTVDRLVFRPVRGRGALTPVVSAIGLSLVLQNLGLLVGALPVPVFGYGHSAAAPKAFVQPLAASNLLPSHLGVVVSAREVLVLVTCLVCLAALRAVVHGSRLGRAMRAVAQDPLAAQLMGVEPARITGLAFALGGALAGVAAVVYGLCIGTVHYQMGFQNGLYAFVAAVVGGIGSLSGAVLGGLIIGLVRAACDQWLGAQWQAAVLFGLLIAILLLRPTGLLGRPRLEKV